MGIEEAKAYARKARKLAPGELYDFARALEEAVGQLAQEIAKLRRDREPDRRPRKSA